MSRVKFLPDKQREFLERVHNESQLSWQKLGLISGVSGRTLRDWRREKYTGSYEVLLHRYSVKLAELLGVILGDGSLTNSQVTVTLDRKTDREYSNFVGNLFLRIFGKQPTVSDYPHRNTLVLRLSGVNLVNILKNLGLTRGDKIRNQIDFPDWVKGNLKFSQACVRGLFDTDGGLYFHRHWTKGIRYRNLGFCFTNYSKPLVKSFIATLKESGYNYKLKENSRGSQVFIYDLKEIKRYFSEIGSNNPKHIYRLRKHLANPRRIS